MASDKKYFYMRLKEDFFESPVIKIVEAFPEGYLYTNILLRLYLASLKDEGRLMLAPEVPYTTETLACVIGHKPDDVKKAVDLFVRLGMVEVLDSGAIYMKDIQNYIGRATTTADRQRDYDRKIREEKESAKNIAEDLRNLEERQEILKKSCQKSRNLVKTQEILSKHKKTVREIEIEKEIDKEIEIEPQNEPTVNHIVFDAYRNITGNRVNGSEALKAKADTILSTHSMEEVETCFKRIKQLEDKSKAYIDLDWLLQSRVFEKFLEDCRK